MIGFGYSRERTFESDARRAATDVLRTEPKFSISAWLKHRRYDARLLAREADALGKAGPPQ